MVNQYVAFFVLSFAVACISRTVCKEEVFREPRELCEKWSKQSNSIMCRKIFYIPTCEYCFSHYVTIGVLAATGFRFLYPDWRGLLVAFFTMPLMANFVLKWYARLSVEITATKVEIEKEQGGVAARRAA